MSRRHVEVSWARATAWLGLLTAAAASLVQAGAGALSTPLGSWHELLTWLESSPPPVAAAALLRLAALGLCGYLGAILVVTLLADLLSRCGPRSRPCQRVPAALWRLVASGARSGVVGSVLLGWLGPLLTTATPAGATAAAISTTGSDDPTSHTATMSHVAPGDDEPPAGTATTTDLDAAPPPGAEPAPTSTPGTGATSDAATPPAPEPGTTTTTPAAHEDWVVATGESFWSIAEDALTEARGARPDDHEVASYWRRLISANHDRLMAPDNPDLLLTGQRLQLPPPS
jgi:hypothetical protein